MKAVGIFFGILLAIALTILWYFSDNIKGYYTFKEYCEKEGGLTVYEPLEKNVGWLADDKYDARDVSLLSNIGFARYKENEILYDVYYLSGNITADESYRVDAADESKSAVYFFKKINRKVNGEARLRLYGIEIYDINSNKIHVKYYSYGFEKFDRSKTPLDMPSEIYCHTSDHALSLTELSLSLKKINTAFNK